MMPLNADAIADIIKHVHVASAIFLRGEFHAPWAFASCTAGELASMLGTGQDHPILFHVVEEGECCITLASGETAIARAGDVLVLPYSDVHTMGWPAEAAPVPVLSLLPSAPQPGLPTMRHGGNGPGCKIFCGYLHCEDLVFDPFLRALPALVHVKSRPGATADLIKAGLNYTVAAALSNAPSDPVLGTRLTELLFVETLRQFMETLGEQETGLLAAAKDPIVARALGHLHAQPFRSWTVEELADQAATSRAVLTERFNRFLGQSPIRYLTHWRLQLAMKMLTQTSQTIAEVAHQNGYASEEAFSRAFKRMSGMAPSVWRDLPTHERTAALRNALSDPDPVES